MRSKLLETRLARQLGLALAVLLSLTGIAGADPPLRLEAGATTLHAEDVTSKPGIAFGGSLALARWSPFTSFALIPHIGVVVARRNANIAVDQIDQTDSVSYTMDSLEIPLLLRAELTLAGRSFYVHGGAYGGRLLRAQRMELDGIGRSADAASTVDLGLLAGGVFELTSFAWGELFVEMRYQRSYRAVVPDSDSNHESFSFLLGYGLGSSSSGSASSWTDDRSLALKGGLVATRLPSSESSDSNLGPGFSFGAAFSPARFGSWLALVPQLELSFVHRSADHAAIDGGKLDGDTRDGSLKLDHIDAALLMRLDLTLAGRRVYGLGGVYGSVLLRAQRSQEDLITDARDTVHSLDAGWLTGAGIEFAATSKARLGFELRYQRSLRDLFPDGPDSGAIDSLAFLFGITYGSESSPGPTLGSELEETAEPVLRSSSTNGKASKPATRRRGTSVLLGRPGDRWLHTMRFTRIERATRAGQHGYQVSYDIAGHGKLALFWPRDRIDFDGNASAYRRKSMKLRKGRLWYPTRITRRSLPQVHQGILTIENAYARQADGGTAAMGGFAVVAGLGGVKPSLRTTSPRPPSRTPIRRPGRTTPRQTSGSTAANPAPTGTAAQVPAATGTAVRASSRALGRALEAAGHVRPPGAAAHHIVAGGARAAAPARTVLQRFGIGINDAVNGVFLPATRAAPNPAGAAVHSTLHTRLYYQTINRRLAQATTRQEVLDVLQAIRRALLNGGL